VGDSLAAEARNGHCCTYKLRGSTPHPRESRVLNKRKINRSLTHHQVKLLTSAWYHAAKTGQPLNRLVTFRPIGIDAMEGVERCRLFDKLRRQLDQYARQHRFPLAVAWSRESAEDGVGEHLHCLMHVPARWQKHFGDTVWRWLPERAATEHEVEYMTSVDVRPANQRTLITEAGKRRSAIGYLVKQMSTQAGGRMEGIGGNARWVRHMHRVKGGPVLGKRAGVSQSLGKKAVDAWRPDSLGDILAAE
jgi:hypothetical protein